MANIDFNEKKGFICDMDGVIYHGNIVLPGVAEFIGWLNKEKKDYLFLTNNSGNTPCELKLKLARMAFEKERWPEAFRDDLMEKMLDFAQMMLTDGAAGLPEFEQAARALYEESGQVYGYGYKRFYGKFLIESYKSQRRYKEALHIQEEISECIFLK